MSVLDTPLVCQEVPTARDDINLEDELEDEFNAVIAAIDVDEENVLDFNIPEAFDIDDLLSQIRFRKEITESQTQINAIVLQLERNQKCVKFVKKVFYKMSTILKSLDLSKSSNTENVLAKVFAHIHDYTTSLSYTMDCLELCGIDGESTFIEEHRIVCYRIVEYIRGFMIEEKVSELNSNAGKFMKRFVTDASKPRIRYVAGYCVATLRKRYTQIKQSNMFAHTKEAQSSFREANVSLRIISTLKEEEHYLKQVTTNPESLVDIERKQNSRRGLTNITDSFFNFFLILTNECLSKLVQENLLSNGKTMYNKCLDIIKNEKILYEKFIHMVVTRLYDENTEEFCDTNVNFVVSEHLENLVIISAQILQIYNELLGKYFMVLFAQFRRDVKSALKVQKTMAHRKQIKVAKGSEKSTKPKGADKVTKPKSVKSRKKTGKTSTQSVMTPQTDPTPGPSTVTEEESPSAVSDADSDSEVCAKCHHGRGNDWIQCDSCNSWLHRKCAGLSNYMKWKKYSYESATWYCSECQ